MIEDGDGRRSGGGRSHNGGAEFYDTGSDLLNGCKLIRRHSALWPDGQVDFLDGIRHSPKRRLKPDRAFFVQHDQLMAFLRCMEFGYRGGVHQRVQFRDECTTGLLCGGSKFRLPLDRKSTRLNSSHV